MPRLLHLTTTDISLELLLGPQLSAFVEAGYDVHVASAPGPFVGAIEDRGVTFHALEHSTRAMALTSDLKAAREVYQLFKELKPDIVHTHNPKPGVYGRIAARLAKVPVVVNTVHGLYAQPEDTFAKKAAVYSLERLAAAFSHAELVQNVEDVATLEKLRVPADKLSVLGNGIDLTRFRPPQAQHRQDLRASLGLAETDIVIGAVGRLVAEKGYLELFEAFEQVRAQIPNAKLLVVGPHEPDKADALDPSAVDRASANGVQFLGHRDDVEGLYGAMDIYVLASWREGFPRSAMEAAASGLPLVCTDIRGCRQVVDHERTGLLVPRQDPQSLAAALVALASSPSKRAAMAAAAQTKAKSDFDQRHVIDLTLATYQRLLAPTARLH